MNIYWNVHRLEMFRFCDVHTLECADTEMCRSWKDHKLECADSGMVYPGLCKSFIVLIQECADVGMCRLLNVHILQFADNGMRRESGMR